MPKIIPISVIMPVFNSEKYLGEAINSILNQTFKDFELIIIDDCSIDSSATIINEYKKRDSRIVLFPQKKNSGIAAARNKGLELSSGEFIALMDSDDISLPDRLEKQYNFIKSHPEIGVLGGGVELVDSNGRHTSKLFPPETDFMISWSMCFCDPMINPTVMMKRSIVLESGGYNDFRESVIEYYPEDYDLWIRISGKTNFYNLHDIILKLRKHSSNITKKCIDSTIENSLKISQKYLATILGINPSIDEVAVLWNTDQNKRMNNAHTVLVNLFEYFGRRKEISVSETHFLRKDVSKRLIKIAIRHPEDPKFIYAIIQAHKYQPFIIFQMLSTRVQRIWSR
jgi:glycosyltransferase involved in cell wall biosynthesis